MQMSGEKPEKEHSQAIQVTPASLDDIPELVPVMKRAFDDDSQKHLGKPWGGPEGYDDGDFFRRWMPYKESVSYKILLDGRVVGGLIVWVYEHERNTLGTIFVDPAFQDRGIGSKAWRLVEGRHPDARSWTLGTPSWAEKNHQFYVKNGFSKVREDSVDDVSGGVSFIFRKDME